MRLIGREKIDRFSRRHSLAKRPLAEWVMKTQQAVWRNAADIKATFQSVDKVGDYYIFNMGGNKFRLVAIVEMRADIVIVERIMTHAEYDRWNKERR